VTVVARLLIADLGPLRAFACLTASCAERTRMRAPGSPRSLSSPFAQRLGDTSTTPATPPSTSLPATSTPLDINA
jgi:hypothetical protein